MVFGNSLHVSETIQQISELKRALSMMASTVAIFFSRERATRKWAM